MLHDIRSKKIEGPLARQADIWREYTDKAESLSDIAIRLPTGSGKTLVGIVLGEWRRRKNNERVLYLCPTKQLVKQVAAQAREVYGIDVAEFTGSKHDYDIESKNSYRRNEKIAIAPYSSLFNTNPFFENPDIIILDDAHACENYISTMYSFEVDRLNNEKLFSALIDIIAESYDKLDLSKFNKNKYDVNWIDKIPTYIFSELSKSLKSFLDEALVDAPSLYYPWSVIREHLDACHLYLSSNSILIRPLTPPTFSHSPFTSAKQRIYMSATLGNGGDLERITGRKNIFRLRPPTHTDEQGIGRRFFIFPEVAFTKKESDDLIESALKIFGRGLFIAPKNLDVQQRIAELSKLNEYKIFTAAEIENSKKDFTNTPKAVAVVANRYDGMDFPHDECRLLVLEGLPKAANLQEKFILNKMGAGIILNDRIQTRIVQAVGRCTRANSDFAAVIILGQEWLDYLLTKDNVKYLHPEIQAELDFGEYQSSTDIADVLDNIRVFSQQDQAWQEANEEIIGIRSNKKQETAIELAQLSSIADKEISYLRHLWMKDFSSAYEECRNILGALTEPSLKGYRAMWNYLAGSALELAKKNNQVASDDLKREYYMDAMKSTIALPWLVDLAKIVKTVDNDEYFSTAAIAKMTEGIEKQLVNLGIKHNRKFDYHKNNIISGIASADPFKFENAQLELGKLLGFECGNTEYKAAPDPWWVVDENTCIVFEDHTGATNNVLSVEKARQVCCHDNWIRENVRGLKDNALIIKMLITPVTTVAPGGMEHLQEVYVRTPSEFRSWALNTLRVLTHIRQKLTSEGDLVWRADAITELDNNDLSPSKIINWMTLKRASDTLQRS